MRPSYYLVPLMLLTLASGCQQEEAKISALESAGATISKGLDGSVTTVRFPTSNISRDNVEAMKGISTLKQVYGVGADLTDEDVSLLAALESIQVLSLPNAAVGAATIEAIAASMTIHTVDFSGSTSLTDDVIKGLEGQPHLKVLNLSNTELTDASINVIGSIKNIQELSLVGTKITADAIEQLATSVPNLKMLATGSELLTDEAIAAASRFTALETLEVVDSGLTGSTFDVLSAVSSIRKLNFSGNPSLTNDNIMKLGQLDGLENLNVEGSQFTSIGLSQNGFKKLSTLIANGTKVTDEEIANFTGMPVLYSVKLKGTSATEAGIRKHFAPTSQTGFEWDAE